MQQRSTLVFLLVKQIGPVAGHDARSYLRTSHVAARQGQPTRGAILVVEVAPRKSDFFHWSILCCNDTFKPSPGTPDCPEGLSERLRELRGSRWSARWRLVDVKQVSLKEALKIPAGPNFSHGGLWSDAAKHPCVDSVHPLGPLQAFDLSTSGDEMVGWLFFSPNQRTQVRAERKFVQHRHVQEPTQEPSWGWRS
jgi:hypothetical protein